MLDIYPNYALGQYLSRDTYTLTAGHNLCHMRSMGRDSTKKRLDTNPSETSKHVKRMHVEGPQVEMISWY